MLIRGRFIWGGGRGGHFSVQILLALCFMKSATISPSRKTEVENRVLRQFLISCNFIYLMSIKAFLCLPFSSMYFHHLTKKDPAYGTVERKALLNSGKVSLVSIIQ